MHSTPTQFGLALSILVVWPVLGAGDQARAGFMLNQPSEPPLLSLVAEDVLTAATSIAGREPLSERLGSQSFEEERIPKAPALGNPSLVFFSLWTFGLAQTPGSCTTTSGGSSVSVSSLHATLSASVFLPPHAEVRGLPFSYIRFQPPPFASRLFRPPRLA